MLTKGNDDCDLILLGYTVDLMYSNTFPHQFCFALFFFFFLSLFLVCQVWLCRLQLPRAHFPCPCWKAHHSLDSQSRQHWDQGKHKATWSSWNDSFYRSRSFDFKCQSTPQFLIRNPATQGKPDLKKRVEKPDMKSLHRVQSVNNLSTNFKAIDSPLNISFHFVVSFNKRNLSSGHKFLLMDGICRWPFLCIPAHMESSNRQSDLDKDELLKQQRSKVWQFPHYCGSSAVSIFCSFFFFYNVCLPFHVLFSHDGVECQEDGKFRSVCASCPCLLRRVG